MFVLRKSLMVYRSECRVDGWQAMVSLSLPNETPYVNIGVNTA